MKRAYPRRLRAAAVVVALSRTAVESRRHFPIRSSTIRSRLPAASRSVVVAGGCFWGVEAVYQHIKGVISATSGYSGGTVKNPSYEAVCTGRTGHAESVRIVFDPSQVSFGQILKIFFLRRARPDRGEPAGTRHRHAVSIRSVLSKARIRADHARLHRPARSGENLPPADRDAGDAARQLLPGRGLSPGLRGEAPLRAVYRDQRFAESRRAAQRMAGAVPEVNPRTLEP